MNINEIENLTEAQAAKMAEEKLSIKGHDIYLVDFGGYFKYSCLVFRGGAHIKYANDYELHHPDKTRQELRDMYIKALNLKLFTDEEIGDDLTDYTEFTRKENFIRNYWGLQRPYKSVFKIGDEPKEVHDVPFSHYDPVCFAYYQDEAFVKRHKQLLTDLYMAQDRKRQDADYWFKAFLFEMANHEYHINLDADYDTLSAFGNVKWRGQYNSIDSWFNDCGFNDLQRKSYREAVREYYRRPKI